MAKQPPKQPPEPTSPARTDSAPPYNFHIIEAALCDDLRDDSGNLNRCLQAFRMLMYHAHQRKLTDENFADVVHHTCDLHIIGVRLEDAVALKTKIAKRGGKTANLDKTIGALTQAIKGQRAWALDHLKLVRQCALPGTPIN